MPVFSKIASFSQFRSLLKSPVVANVAKNAVREMSDHGPRTIPLTPSRFQWHKFKDLFHYYVMVGAIPLGALVFYSNVYIGPAQLEEIPEGYTPKHWEYHRHPITRWFARYVYPSPQQDYEKMCHVVWEEQQKVDLRRLEKKIRNKMAERHDTQAYYYRPAMAKYQRIAKEASDYEESLEGDR